MFCIHIHIKLRVINRIVGLLSRSAHLEAAAEAAMKQAESATKTAKTLMEAVCLFSFNNYMLILN